MDPKEENRLADEAKKGSPEVVLNIRPLELHIEVLSGSKTLPLVHGKRMYTLKSSMKEWSLDGAGNVPIMRYGFCIVPDFAGTAHFYCGSSLDAAIGDLLEWDRTPTKDDALKSYIIRSRVKQSDHLLITQPYSPQLFRQGKQPGPDLLHRVLTEKILPEDAKRQ